MRSVGDVSTNEIAGTWQWRENQITGTVREREGTVLLVDKLLMYLSCVTVSQEKTAAQ